MLRFARAAALREEMPMIAVLYLNRLRKRMRLEADPTVQPGGVLAVRAALNPATTDAIYFVAANTGGHKFSTTLQEHLKAKQERKKARYQPR